MRSNVVFISAGLALLVFCHDVRCWAASRENNIWEEEDFPARRPEGASEPQFYDDLTTGPDRLAIELFGENELDGGKEKLAGSDVDEETIRKAEKNADKDLLNGLSRILKNNETLKDVFRAENVYEIP